MALLIMALLELLLLEDIPGIGRRNDIVVVRDGFALNNLLPRRRALVATPTVRKRYAEHIKRRAEEKARETDLAQSAAAILREKLIIFTAKATSTGKLYGAITAKMISEALVEQLEIEVPEASIILLDPIKALGAHRAKAKIAEQEVEVKIEVRAEG